ncbi:MAG: hypothetical protein ACRDT8_08055 [Micromonosporaceae bacterium]
MNLTKKRVTGAVAVGLLAAGLAVSPSFAKVSPGDPLLAKESTGAAAGDSHGGPAGKESSPGDAGAPTSGRGIDRDPSAAAYAAAERELAAWERAHPQQAGVTSIVTVPVFVHVFYDRNNRAGYLPAKKIWAQLRWLNHSYSGGQDGRSTRFRFKLRGYERVGLRDHTIGFNSKINPTKRTKRLMRRNHPGGKGFLNIWVGDLDTPYSGTLFGRASFPWEQAKRPSMDGVWIKTNTWRRVGAGVRCTDQGDTVVHEVGHWVGLKHTDTSPSCGGQQNFMSYGRDFAMDSFNRHQVRKSSRMWNRYRS